MQRWNGVTGIPADVGETVLTIGNFDGVHRGHQVVLGEVVRLARERAALAVAITFDPHPLAVLHPDRAPAVLTPLPQRLGLLEVTGLDAVLVLPFTRELASWSPERFAEEVLAQALHARLVVVGRDMRFGHRNAGNVDTLRGLGEALGFEVRVVEDTGPVVAGSPSRRWSSTWVRDLLARGEVSEAADVLGHPARLGGVVVHGDHRGRELGYPTANLGPDCDGVVPADGVYAGWLVRPALPADDPDHRLPAAVSIGTNPTFDGTSRRVESYVLDRDDLDLYGERVVVEFVARLRPTLRFDGVDALVRQMAADVERCRKLLSGDPAH